MTIERHPHADSDNTLATCSRNEVSRFLIYTFVGKLIYVKYAYENYEVYTYLCLLSGIIVRTKKCV